MSDFLVPRITDAGDLKGKRVLVRASLNVPVEAGVVTNAYRITHALETISYLKDQGAQVIVIGHLGREPSETLAPVFTELQKHIALSFVPALVGDEVEAALANLSDGEVLLLENVRSHPGEKENSDDLAETLASYADVFVSDAFPVAHREQASVVGVPKYLKSYAGHNFAREFAELSKVLIPARPALFLLGGAKFATKAPLIEASLDNYDHIFIGGALANDFLKADGHNIGDSLVSDAVDGIEALLKSKQILLPIDLVVDGPDGKRTVPVDGVKDGEKILDAGPATVAMLSEHIAAAKTVLWNGPFGYYEGGYDAATLETAKLIAASDAYGVVGGGDTVAAIESLDLADQFGFISTAGGAMITFLERGTLPGIEALKST